jgi:DNA-directed RNA polymerase specialized sigma24 family protein
MHRIIHSPAEAMLVESLAFEPALRAQLYRDGTDPAHSEEILQEVYARLLTAAETGRVRVRHVRTALFNILADVLAATRGEHPPAGAQPLAGHQSLATELANDAGKSFTSCLRSSCKFAAHAGRATDRDEIRRLVTLAATFPTPLRRIFTLRKVYGHPPHQIARELNLTEREVQRCLIAAALACTRHVFDADDGRREH